MFGFQVNYVHVGFTPFCMSEVRMLMHGKMVVAGIPYDAVPGDNAKQKRQLLLCNTIDGMRELINTAGGFLMQLSDVGAIQIPSGFMVIMGATEECIGLRWSSAGDDRDKDRVAHLLAQFLASFPELRNPSHGLYQLHEGLTSD